MPFYTKHNLKNQRQWTNTSNALALIISNVVRYLQATYTLWATAKKENSAKFVRIADSTGMVKILPITVTYKHTQRIIRIIDGK